MPSEVRRDLAFADEARICIQCASCVSRCPSPLPITPNIRKMIRMVQLGMIEEILQGDSLWACALCLECCGYCPLGVKTCVIVTSLREMAVAQGLLPKPAVYFTNNTLRRGRPLPLTPEEMTSWAQGLNLPRAGERIFYAGIYLMMDLAESSLRTTSKFSESRVRLLSRFLIALQRFGLDKAVVRMGQRVKPGEEFRRSLISSVKVLSRLGVDLAYLYEEEPWCGIDLHTYGLRDDFAKHAEKVSRRFQELGVKEIITPDTLSAFAFKNLYPQAIDSFGIEVKHFTEVVAEKLKDKKVSLKIDNTFIVYSDPCYLARHMGVMAEPREIIGKIKGARLREVESSGLATRCDGGGGMEVILPKLAMEMAKARAEELMDTRPEMIVTACPVCVMMLKLGLEEIDGHTEVVNIEDLILRALGDKA
ncbi:MAG: (Fe-S)-binding protein [Dehalococcoidia bacterium]